ncbi:MAG: Mercuric reductase, partial [Planctomycetota bacterium]
QNALFWGRKRASTLLIPWCTYTTPELAHVGLSQTMAGSQGVCVDVYQEHFAECDRAVLDGEDAGFVRVLCRRGTDRILGVTIVGANAGDLIGEASLAMKHRLGLAKFSGAIHPYPTRADILRKLGDQYQRTKLRPWVKSLLRWRFGCRGG